MRIFPCAVLRPRSVLWIIAVVAFLIPDSKAGAQPPDCPALHEFLSQSRPADWQDPAEFLRQAEGAVLRGEAPGRRAPCLVWIADAYRDRGLYEAERLYLAAVEDAPEAAGALEAAARYYRNYRGAKGLFASSEPLYLRAEQALARHPPAAGEEDAAALLRERIVRGRIELQKREGLGLATPRAPGDGLGLYLGSEVDAGDFPFAHNDLATPARTLLNADPAFDVRQMLRDHERLRWRNRLRLRLGSLPYLDVAWLGVDESNTLASQTTPVTFSDVKIGELEVGLEDARSVLPLGDLLWRVDYRSGTFDAEGPGEEEQRRLTATATWTRSFGRLKSDLQLLGSSATVEPAGAVESDDDVLIAANVRFLYFHKARDAERLIDPRGHEYAFGYVSRKRDFGPSVSLVQDTWFVDVKLRELATGRADLEALVNRFQNKFEGKEGEDSSEDSSDTETHLLLTYRLVDRVNRLWPLQSGRAVGLAQWALVLRLLDDRAGSEIPSFASRGFSAGSFVELFSARMNHSTVILEGTYEKRDYDRLGLEDRRSRFALRLGF